MPKPCRKPEIYILLENWAERRMQALHSRALFIPEETHTWALYSGKKGYVSAKIVSSGVCWERATAAPIFRRSDEFGYTMLSLPEIDRALIVADYFDEQVLAELQLIGRETWLEYRGICKLPERALAEKLIASWRKLWRAWNKKREELRLLKAEEIVLWQ